MLTLQKTGRIKQLHERPERFVINRHNPLYGSLVFAGLGQMAGGYKYRDSSTYHNDGSLINYTGVPTWKRAIGRPVLVCNGTSQYIALSNVINLGTSNSCSFWSYTNSIANNLVGPAGASFSSEGYFFVYTSSQLYGFVNNGIGGTIVYTPTINSWQHYFVQRTPSAMTFYVNGKPLGTALVLSPSTTTGPTIRYIGQTSNSFYHGGSLSDVLIFNNTLSLSAISRLADPSNVMLDMGHNNCLILPPKRKLFTNGLKKSGGDFISTFW